MNTTELLRKTGQFWYVSDNRIKGDEQDRIFIVARQMFLSIARKKKTLQFLSNFLGKRHHSTIMNALEKHQSDLFDRRYADDYKRYLEYIGEQLEDQLLDYDSIICERDHRWEDACHQYYGKMLNETLMDKIKLKL